MAADLFNHFSCEMVLQRSGGVPTVAEYRQEQEQAAVAWSTVCDCDISWLYSNTSYYHEHGSHYLS